MCTQSSYSAQIKNSAYDLSAIIEQALQAQNLMWAPAAVTVSMFFINIAFNALLVRQYGFTGAAYAQSASRIAQFLLLTGTVNQSRNTRSRRSIPRSPGGSFRNASGFRDCAPACDSCPCIGQ